MAGSGLRTNMSVTRLVWKGQHPCPGELLLPSKLSHHAHVTRVQAGEAVELLDLEGTVGAGVLLAWEGKQVRIRIDTVQHDRGEPPGPVVVGLGILHTQAFDWAVEKLTELGVTRLVPLVCARVQGRRHEDRVERWQRLSEAAVAQCGRSRPLVVDAPCSFARFVADAPVTRLIADGAAGQLPPICDASALALLIGPEGGLTEHELAVAAESGFLPFSLGSRTLRAETAAVAGVAVACHRAGWL